MDAKVEVGEAELTTLRKVAWKLRVYLQARKAWTDGKIGAVEEYKALQDVESASDEYWRLVK